MSDRRSTLTISAERVRQTDERPGGRGFLPAALPVAGVLCDARPESPNDPSNTRWIADLALEATDAAGAFTAYAVEGLAEVTVMGPVPLDLLGQSVRPVDLLARFTSPDAIDISQRIRAELLLSCSGFEAVGVTPSTSSRRNRTEEAPTPVEAA